MQAQLKLFHSTYLCFNPISFVSCRPTYGVRLFQTPKGAAGGLGKFTQVQVQAHFRVGSKGGSLEMLWNISHTHTMPLRTTKLSPLPRVPNDQSSAGSFAAHLQLGSGYAKHPPG